MHELTKHLRIVRARPDDWPFIQSIYAEGIATGNATFTIEPPRSWAAWAKGKHLNCCMVAKIDEQVVGWVALGTVSTRPVYAGVADINIYVAGEQRGQGIGAKLLAAVIAAAEKAGIWTIEARIFPENEASLRLHRRLGFREVGIHEKIGYMHFGPYQGHWRDVLLLEHRSHQIAQDTLTAQP
jgi:phosphinothricin acetyltransferase